MDGLHEIAIRTIDILNLHLRRDGEVATRRFIDTEAIDLLNEVFAPFHEIRPCYEGSSPNTKLTHFEGYNRG